MYDDNDNENFGRNNRRSRSKLKIAIIAIVAVVVAAIVIAGPFFQQVGTGRIAVVTRFGKVVGIEETGLHFKPAWDEYHELDTTQVQVRANYSTATKDNQSLPQVITAQVQIIPTKSNVEKLYKKFLGNQINGIVKPTLYSGFKSATAKYTLEDAIAKRDQLEQDMLSQVKGTLKTYGIDGISVQIEEVTLPKDYRRRLRRGKSPSRIS
jgi:regulator of protease activity HflC (stomatin/prohibitin superfamily)